MKTTKKLGLVVAALMMATQINSPALAAVNPADVQTIQSFISARDYAGLKAFIALNPSLLVGTSPLAQALREFNNFNGNLATTFGVASVSDVALDRLADVANRDGIY